MYVQSNLSPTDPLGTDISVRRCPRQRGFLSIIYFRRDFVNCKLEGVIRWREGPLERGSVEERFGENSSVLKNTLELMSISAFLIQFINFKILSSNANSLTIHL